MSALPHPPLPLKENNKMIKAIETTYKGYKFRSRLEARYAVFFDALGIRWEYEHEGYELPIGRYLPDFWLPDFQIHAEVKPIPFSREEFIKARTVPGGSLLLVGVPKVDFYYAAPAIDIDENPTRDEYEHYLSGEPWGRVELSMSVFKRRLWFTYGESIKAYDTRDFSRAVRAARSSRFEFGQSGAR